MCFLKYEYMIKPFFVFNFINMKNILITGGAGFIGSNFINYFLNKYSNIKVINFDLLTYAGNLNNLNKVKSNPNYIFIKGDICNKNLLNEIFLEYDISDIIHFAAESHVDNSITNPDKFIKTNIEGTFNLLNTAYIFWFNSPFNLKNKFKESRFHHISTDEVFGSLNKSGSFTENSNYSPNSPYSASKASSDMLVNSYNKTYGLNTVITNCSNNYGYMQHKEKFIPTIILSALKENIIPVYGKGLQIRDWLFVEDHCESIDKVFFNAKEGETYCIGGGTEMSNIELVQYICKELDKKLPRKNNLSYLNLITFIEDRFGHDFRYSIDASKIKKDLNWLPKNSFKQGIEKTINWYIKLYNMSF
jgi:dTDP-glucose 4,6-dehydratase